MCHGNAEVSIIALHHAPDGRENSLLLFAVANGDPCTHMLAMTWKRTLIRVAYAANPKRWEDPEKYWFCYTLCRMPSSPETVDLSTR